MLETLALSFIAMNTEVKSLLTFKLVVDDYLIQIYIQICIIRTWRKRNVYFVKKHIWVTRVHSQFVFSA